jgi:hypothetical protein
MVPLIITNGNQVAQSHRNPNSQLQDWRYLSMNLLKLLKGEPIFSAAVLLLSS